MRQQLLHQASRQRCGHVTHANSVDKRRVRNLLNERTCSQKLADYFELT